MKSNNSHKNVTSIRVDPKVWKQAKIEAIKKNISVGEFVEKLIISRLRNHRI